MWTPSLVLSVQVSSVNYENILSGGTNKRTQNPMTFVEGSNNYRL